MIVIPWSVMIINMQLAYLVCIDLVYFVVYYYLLPRLSSRSRLFECFEYGTYCISTNKPTNNLQHRSINNVNTSTIKIKMMVLAYQYILPFLHQDPQDRQVYLWLYCSSSLRLDHVKSIQYFIIIVVVVVIVVMNSLQQEVKQHCQYNNPIDNLSCCCCCRRCVAV